MSKATNLSIYLLRKTREADYEKKVSEIEAARHTLGSPFEGYFSLLPSNSGRPAWATAVESMLPVSSSLALGSQTPAGLLTIHHERRTFVLSFGHAWMKLDPDWLEHDYGRKVALNLIKEGDLLEMHTEQVFSRWHTASERAPRATSIDEFGVEFERDLVATVAGVSSEALFGNVVKGATSLRCTVDILTVLPLLKQSLALFGSNAYAKRWPGIDNLRPVTDAIKIAALEAQLDRDLAANLGAHRVVLSTPSQRRGEALVAASYVWGRCAKTAAKTPYLTFTGWEGYARLHKLPVTVASARATPLHLFDDSGSEPHHSTAYQCFGYEADLNKRPHVLSSGVWYEAVPKFVADTNRAIGRLAPPAYQLASWNGTDDEAVYHVNCAKADGSLLRFDRNNVMFGGGSSKFEFCDLMHLPSKTLYFAKIPTRSSQMSHLVEQVRRTAGLFFNPDPGFRQALDAVVTSHYPAQANNWRSSRPRPGDWTLCFVSLGRTADRLPFFAKCSLLNACNDLTRTGHKVAFLKV